MIRMNWVAVVAVILLGGVGCAETVRCPDNYGVREGRCVLLGPSWVHAPEVVSMQPTQVDGTLTIRMTITHPAGLSAINSPEITLQNSGATLNDGGVSDSVAGDVGVTDAVTADAVAADATTADASSADAGVVRALPVGVLAQATAVSGMEGVYEAQLAWSSLASVVLLNDVSGTLRLGLRATVRDSAGRSVVGDFTALLGGCDQALCGGVCATCPIRGSDRLCQAQTCGHQTCPTGYGTTACTDINECEMNRCPNGSACTNTDGSFYCEQWRLITSNGLSNTTVSSSTYDSVNHRGILYTTAGQVFSFNGSEWTFLATTGAPRWASPYVVFDAGRGQVAMFNSDTNNWMDIRVYYLEGTTWRGEETYAGPGARLLGAATFDTQNSEILLFGGQDGATTLHDDLWARQSTRWYERPMTFAGNMPRAGFPELGFDSDANRMLLVFWSSGTVWRSMDRTWEFVASLPAATSGTSRGMVYDPSKHRIVFVNGNTTVSYTNGWTMHPVTTPSNLRKLMYDSDNHRIIGLTEPSNGTGFTETWTLESSTPR